MNEKSYPRLICHLNRLRQNAEAVTERCRRSGIQVAAVVKGANGQHEIAECVAKCGCAQIASSRLSQLERLRDLGLPTMLIRVPMPSEIARLVRGCDYSLESDLSVIERIEEECARQNRTHSVILMADLGDLREGWWNRGELIDAAVRTEHLPHVKLAGIGTNLGCYGAIVPTAEKMEELASVAEDVEAAIGRELEIVSGGSSTTFPLIERGELPKKINHLRIGEMILVNYDFPQEWGLKHMDYLSTSVFVLQAEVLECRVKPTFPQGEIFVDAFGRKPEFEDRGMQIRALLGIGGLDMGTTMRLIPRDSSIRIIGCSSDHTIVESSRMLTPGEILEFDISYSELLLASSAADVTIEYRDD